MRMLIPWRGIPLTISYYDRKKITIHCPSPIFRKQPFWEHRRVLDLRTVLHTTLNGCQTTFQLANIVYYSSQDDQHIINLKPNPNLLYENFSTWKPRGKARKVKQIKQSWDENISSFSTKFKTPDSDALGKTRQMIFVYLEQLLGICSTVTMMCRAFPGFLVFKSWIYS